MIALANANIILLEIASKILQQQQQHSGRNGNDNNIERRIIIIIVITIILSDSIAILLFQSFPVNCSKIHKAKCRRGQRTNRNPNFQYKPQLSTLLSL